MVRRKSLRKLVIPGISLETNKTPIDKKAYTVNIRRRREISHVIEISPRNIVNSIATLVDLQFTSKELLDNKLVLRNYLKKLSNDEFLNNVWNSCKSSGIIDGTPRHYE